MSVADVPELLAIWDHEKNFVEPETVAFRSNRKMFWICPRGHSTYTSVCNRQAGKACGECRKQLGDSRPERDLKDFIRSIYFGPMKFNSRAYIYPYEIDIVLPDRKIGFEFNGTYWHSEKVIQAKHGMSSKAYHELKRKLAEARGVRLLYVWEDDWNTNRDLMKSAVADAIGTKQFSLVFDRMSA